MEPPPLPPRLEPSPLATAEPPVSSSRRRWRAVERVAALVLVPVAVVTVALAVGAGFGAIGLGPLAVLLRVPAFMLWVVMAPLSYATRNGVAVFSPAVEWAVTAGFWFAVAAVYGWIGRRWRWSTLLIPWPLVMVGAWLLVIAALERAGLSFNTDLP